jgi:hypothetical protein
MEDLECAEVDENPIPSFRWEEKLSEYLRRRVTGSL